ncbi:MAG: SpoIID/LytB domain-containing protein [Chloroflexota bacterium]|nr:SpoIID/LytB domain-containing protein [Chloroflexota bacterium]MDE2920213.1 SpoIID/LytB domain-containing protein [Chloroflexota bacterium]
MPETIRVQLTVAPGALRLIPPPTATVRVDSQPLPAEPSAMTVGWALRYLRLPAVDTTPVIDALVTRTPDGARPSGQLLIGPYGWDGHEHRDRRVVRSEVGVAPTLATPRAGLHVGRRILAPFPQLIEIQPQDLADVTTINDRPYRGRVRVDFSGGDPQVVNELRMADYLASVVGSEIPPTWEVEALKAQAVAARNYAVQKVDPSADYDICDSQFCQAYGGVANEYPSTIQAVRETSGVVAMYEGDLIAAYYASNMGDHTTSAVDVWGREVPYLRGVPSPSDVEALSTSWGAEGYRWTRAIPLQRLADLQTGTGVLGELNEVRVLRTAQSGQPAEVELLGNQGAVTLSGDAIRITLGLPSAFAEFRTVPDERLVLLNPTPRRVAALQADGYSLEQRRRSVAFAEAPAGVQLVRGTLDIAEFRLPPRLIVNGRGFGHGVGMSQWGAQGMARAGHSFDEILTHYYSGAVVERVGEDGGSTSSTGATTRIANRQPGTNPQG